MDTLIITINDKRNYGNRLQNWALSRVLSRRGTCRTASTLLDGDLAKGRGTRARERAAHVRDLLRRGSAGHGAAVRRAAVERFDRRWGLDGPVLTFRGGLSGRWRPDAVVIGSDQVWNAMWASPDDLSLRLGMNFDGLSVVSYAASVGTENVPEWAVPTFREGIARMGAVSVREDRAADVLGGIIGRPVTVVADPVALLTPEEWRSVFPGTVDGRKPFALEYFLGEPSIEQRAAMDAFESENGLAVRRAGAPGDPSAGAGPGSLAELACRASVVFTDSYHGCLLALLFGTPVKAFARSGLPQGLDMSSRMRTLDRALGLGGALSSPDDAAPFVPGLSVERALREERERSLGWLEAALEGVRHDGR